MRHTTAFLIAGLLFWLAGAAQALSSDRIVVRDMSGRAVAPLDSARSTPEFHRKPDNSDQPASSKTSERRATVLFFITTDCPIANACAPEIERIYQSYVQKHVAFYLVYVDASQGSAVVRKHHKEYGYSIPAVLDPDHLLVKKAGATVTPETALFSADGRLLYHGRIDDRAVAYGQVRAEPTRRDLRDTLDSYLQGKPIPVSHTNAVGCIIADLGRKH